MPRRPPARYGYARAATQAAVLDQETALIASGCETVWKDVATGKTAARPGWAKCRAGISRGDTLAVTRLSVLAFSLRELLAEAARLRERGITLHVTEQAIDLGALAEVALFAAESAVESSKAGRSARRPRGYNGGRPRKFTPEIEAEIRALMREPGSSPTAIAEQYGTSRPTVYAIHARGQ